MIKVNGVAVPRLQFPDGTASFRYMVGALQFNISWRYEDDGECMQLWYLVKHIREHAPKAEIDLLMLYIPNARMDRVKNADEVFTLKWFADFINTLQFGRVLVLDPHSNVAPALINNIVVVGVGVYVGSVLMELEKHHDQILLCYPDEGAAKRYSDQAHRDYVFGIKHRDWSTGKIESLELTTPDKIAGKTVLIVDDICSRGGTFMHTATALKAAGADKIFLYITHCENTIFDGEVLTSGLFEHVYTTDSLYRGNHPMITVL